MPHRVKHNKSFNCAALGGRGLYRLPAHSFKSVSGNTMRSTDQKIAVENVNVPGKTHNVDAVKYHAMKTAFLKILPIASPGLTQKEIQQQVVDFLPDTIFPGGAKAGWWAKTVQLDLEAKGLVIRESGKPLRWYKVRQVNA